MLINMILVFLGCGTGGVFRYWMTTLVYYLFGHGLPHGTMFVNVSGSFIMGLLTVVLEARVGTLEVHLRGLFLVGVLGGYTTFSSFSMDTINLLETGRYISALVYIFGTVILCLVGVWAGVLLGRQL